MRAPYRPAPACAGGLSLRNAENNDERDDDEEEDDEEKMVDETSAFGPMLAMLEPHLPRLGAFLYMRSSSSSSATRCRPRPSHRRPPRRRPRP